MAFAPALRKFTFTTHVTSSVGWIGAVLVFLALAAIGLTSQDERTVRGAYLVMAPAAWFVLFRSPMPRSSAGSPCLWGRPGAFSDTTGSYRSSSSPHSRR